MWLRRAGVVTAGGGLVTGLSIVDWPVLLALLAVSAMVVGAVCWVVNDQERPKRLALLIRTWHGRPQQVRTGTRPTTRRRSVTGTRAAAPSPRTAGSTGGR